MIDLLLVIYWSLIDTDLIRTEKRHPDQRLCRFSLTIYHIKGKYTASKEPYSSWMNYICWDRIDDLYDNLSISTFYYSIQIKYYKLIKKKS